MAVTITYTILSREGPTDQLENAQGSAVQTAKRYWTFHVSCSFHPGGHVVTVLDPYTGPIVQAAVFAACKTLYQTDPTIGITFSQTF